MTIAEEWAKFGALEPDADCIKGQDGAFHIIAGFLDWSDVEAAARDLALAAIDEWAGIASSTLTEENKIAARREFRARVVALGGTRDP